VSNNVFIADRSNGLLRRVIASGVISTIRTSVRWTLPLGLAFDGNNGLLVVDDLRRQIARVSLAAHGCRVLVELRLTRKRGW
jgi:hypothetical protein